MFFSVIVPVYKVEDYLPACIDSVLQQTFGDFELILVDDGSPDRCSQICEEYAARDSRIRVLHKPNGGLASARRAGIQVARGEYVFNLDSDDAIEPDTLESAHGAIRDTGCEMVSFTYRWVQDGRTVDMTTDPLAEGFYDRTGIETHLFPKLLMDENMGHVSYYLAGKAIKRDLLTPHQLGVSEHISLGEDLCCVIPCYLHAQSVYISKKPAYRYTVRKNSMSKAFQTKQIHLVETVLHEISRHNTEQIADFPAQLSRYSCFMCFAILAAAAEGYHFESIKELKREICNSLHRDHIARADFARISLKSRITIFLMKKHAYAAAFYFLALCKAVKNVLKRG